MIDRTIALRFVEADAAAVSPAAIHPLAATAALALGIVGIPVTLALGAGKGRSRGTLTGEDEIGWLRFDVESFTDEIAEWNNEIVSVDLSTCNQLADGLARQPDMLLGPQENDIGESSLDGVSNTSSPFGPDT
jgi:hypothetical protein